VEAVGCRWTIALRPSPDPPSAEHPIDPGVNRDASLYFHATNFHVPGLCGRGIGAIAPHA
jgi:hypothetical protein